MTAKREGISHPEELPVYEQIRQLEELLQWLDTRAVALGTEAYERLREETISHLARLREELSIEAKPPPPAIPIRSLSQINRELALVESAYEQIQAWVEQAQIDPSLVSTLRLHLSRQAKELRAELGRRPQEERLNWDLEVLDFIIESLPEWAQALPSKPYDMHNLNVSLQQQRSQIVQSGMQEMACLEGLSQRVDAWLETGAIGPVSAERLHQTLSSQKRKWGQILAGREAEVEPVSDLTIMDLSLESLAQWTQEEYISLTERETLDDLLRQKRSQLLQPAVQELALLESTQEQLQDWRRDRLIDRRCAEVLGHHLRTEATRVRNLLADHTLRIPKLSRAEKLDFVLRKLPLWQEELGLNLQQTQSLSDNLESEYQRFISTNRVILARARALLPQIDEWVSFGAIQTSSADSLENYISSRVEELEFQLGQHAASIQPPSRDRVLEHALRMLTAWTSAGHLHYSHTDSLRRYLEAQLASLAVPAAELPVPAISDATVDLDVEAAAMPAAAAPARPAKPPRPPFDWSKFRERAWTFIVSGALLRTLLYLGAFMIVVSAFVLAWRFFDYFPTAVQAVLIFSVPTLFYVAGWAVYAKMKLPVGGSVLIGAGALLLAAVFAAVYQFGGLELDLVLYWLLASIACTLIYAITAWRLPQEFFGYISLIGIGSVFVALTQLGQLSWEWGAVAIAGLSVGMVESSVHLRRASEDWCDLACAARRLPLVLLPFSQAATIVLFIFGPIGLTRGIPAAGAMVVFLLASIGYAWLAWRFPHSILAYASVWSLVVAIGLLMWVSRLTWEWYGVAAALAASLYMLTHRWLGHRLDEQFEQRISYLRAINSASFGLVAIAVVVGVGAVVLGSPWIGILALALAALALAAAAALYERPMLTLAAGTLFIAPTSLAVTRWLQGFAVPQWGAWLMTAWSGLAMAYLGLATLLRQQEKHGAWLNWIAHILTPVATIGLLFNYADTMGNWFAGPTLAALGLALAVYVISAIIHDSGHHPALSDRLRVFPESVRQAFFLWPASLLIPLWLFAAWTGLAQDQAWLWPWLGPILAGLALTYVGIGQLLSRLRPAYHLPPHALAYALAVVAASTAFSDQSALMLALYIIVGVLAALAASYRRVVETSAAALLFIWPFQLTLQLLSSAWPAFTPHAFSLTYALLSSLAYIPLGLALQRSDRQYARPVFAVGYGLAAYAVVTSLLGYTGIYPNIEWVGVVTPLIVTALLAFSTYRFKQALFAWVSASVAAITFGQAFALVGIPWPYIPAAWVGVAFVYLLGERSLKGLTSSDKAAWLNAFRWPLGVGSAALCILGLALTAQETFLAFAGSQFGNVPTIILAQLLAVGLAIIAAWLYQSRWPLYLQPWLAFFPVTLFFIGYGGRILGQPLLWPQYGLVWASLGLVEFVAAILLDSPKAPEKDGPEERALPRYAHGLYLAGYALTSFGALWSLRLYPVLLWTLGVWVAQMVLSALLVYGNSHHTWDDLLRAMFRHPAAGTKRKRLLTVSRSAFLWLAAGAFPPWCVLLLDQLRVRYGFELLGLGLASLLLLSLTLWLRRIERTYTWPLHVASQTYTLLGLILSAQFTIGFLAGRYPMPGAAPFADALMLLQTVGVIFYATSAWVLRRRLFAHLASWLAVPAVSMFFVRYARPLLGQPLSWTQFGLVWGGLGLIQVVVAVWLDRPLISNEQAPPRYARGPYLAGYTLALFAVGWTAQDQTVLVWTLGAWIALAACSAFLVHRNRHHTWNQVLPRLFGKGAAKALIWLFGQRAAERIDRLVTAAHLSARSAFLWVAVWPLPLWMTIFLRRLSVYFGFETLGFGATALAFLGLALWLKRLDDSYAWPLYSAGQFYTLVGVILSAPFTVHYLAGNYTFADAGAYAVAFFVLQAVAVVFYVASARIFQTRLFAFVAAGLSIVPYTLIWARFGPTLTWPQFSWVWMGWAAVLLGIGFALDRAKIRYAHGPYLTGYALITFALIWSAADLEANLYTLGTALILTAASHTLMHLGLHRTFADFTAFIWRKAGTIGGRAARTAFLFFTAYAFPIWLVRLLFYHNVALPWRGLALALTAPIYIALGLALRRTRTDTEPTWPLYSAGYVLTALGAMITYENERLAAWVLLLNAAVYAASAYIFRQSVWLYLSNLLLPVTALLFVHSHLQNLPPEWVAPILMGLAGLYIGIGHALDRVRRRSTTDQSIAPFGLPFYIPGYLLSAVALSVAAKPDLPYLTLSMYGLGVLLYAISSWTFRESVFLYPTAWLAAVPYYVAMTLTPLPRSWYGIGWLPLVVLYILLGRFAFKSGKPLTLRTALNQPAFPFYLLGYGLSVSVMIISRHDPLIFALGCTFTAIVYFGSAALFHRAAWLYPGLLATHLALAAYFAIAPSGQPVQMLALPFQVLTWLVALTGYYFFRRFPATHPAERGKARLKLARWTWDIHYPPALEHLLTPSWAHPFFLFAALDVILWQVFGLQNVAVTIIVATGHMLLVGLFATLWQDRALVYGTIVFLLLAVAYFQYDLGLSFPNAIAQISGVGLGLYLIGWMVERVNKAPWKESNLLRIWPVPLSNAAIGLATLGAVAALPTIGSYPSASALAFAFAGALYLTIAYRWRQYPLGYLGMGLIEAAWVIFLLLWSKQPGWSVLRDPQWYAIPAGLYLVGIGFLERRRKRHLFALIVESFGLSVLLLTSLIQSIVNGKEGFVYFLILLVEGTLVILWGAVRRIKIPFIAGIAASVINIIAQLIVLIRVYEINRWFVILGGGVLLVAAGILFEWKRKQILAQAQIWREGLEEWD
jgi:hypothetical protein